MNQLNYKIIVYGSWTFPPENLRRVRNFSVRFTRLSRLGTYDVPGTVSERAKSHKILIRGLFSR